MTGSLAEPYPDSGRRLSPMWGRFIATAAFNVLADLLRHHVPVLMPAHA